MEFVDVAVDLLHEDVIKDIKENLNGYLYNSHKCLLQWYYKSMYDKKIRSGFYIELNYLVEVLHRVNDHLITTTTTTGSLPSSKTFVDRIVDFSSLKNRIMDDYVETIRNRFYHATGEQTDDLTVRTLLLCPKSTTTTTSAAAATVVDDEDDWEMMVMKKLVEERHESVLMINKCMEELEQVLFKMYMIVQKQVIATLVSKKTEARRKRFDMVVFGAIQGGGLLLLFCLVAIFSYYHKPPSDQGSDFH